MTATLSKSDLRAAALARREALSDEQRAEAAEAMAQRKLPFEIVPGMVVSGYSPIRNEIDPVPLMRKLAVQGADPGKIVNAAQMSNKAGPWTAVYGDGQSGKVIIEALRSWRLVEARRQGVPAFRIFSDLTLRAIAQRRPEKAAELLAVPGIGASAVEKYGREIYRICQILEEVEGGEPGSSFGEASSAPGSSPPWSAGWQAPLLPTRPVSPRPRISASTPASP